MICKTYCRDHVVKFLCTTFVVWVSRQPLWYLSGVITVGFLCQLGMQSQLVPESTALSHIITCLNSNININIT